MGINLSELEAKALDVVHGVFHEAAATVSAAEPAIWDAVAAELAAVGVPPVVTQAVSAAVSGLIADYKGRQAAPAAPAAPEPAVDPTGVTGAAAPAESVSTVAPAEDDAAARFAAAAAGSGAPA